MNVISSGENDVSCAATKLTLAICHPFPFTSKYNLALSISSAIILSVFVDFCNTLFVDDIVVIGWFTCTVPLVDCFEPLKKALI